MCQGVGFAQPVEAIWKPSMSTTRPSASSTRLAAARIASTSNWSSLPGQTNMRCGWPASFSSAICIHRSTVPSMWLWNRSSSRSESASSSVSSSGVVRNG